MIHISCSKKQYSVLFKQKISFEKAVRFDIKKHKVSPPFAFDDETGKCYLLESMRLDGIFGPSKYQKVGDIFAHVV